MISNNLFLFLSFLSFSSENTQWNGSKTYRNRYKESLYNVIPAVKSAPFRHQSTGISIGRRSNHLGFDLWCKTPSRSIASWIGSRGLFPSEGQMLVYDHVHAKMLISSCENMWSGTPLYLFVACNPYELIGICSTTELHSQSHPRAPLFCEGLLTGIMKGRYVLSFSVPFPIHR
jgi:hypothetical protein